MSPHKDRVVRLVIQVPIRATMVIFDPAWANTMSSCRVGLPAQLIKQHLQIVLLQGMRHRKRRLRRVYVYDLHGKSLDRFSF